MTDCAKSDFVRDIVAADVAAGKHGGKVVTRFPPEPNGYLHVGHAKAICLDFGIADENAGVCHLRFDDTNPAKEDSEYVESIKEDVAWLGFDWGDHLYYASDYFAQMYEYAVGLIKKKKAYVCELNVEQFREYRGVPTRPGKESPHRERPVAESLELFEKMRAGEFEDGEYVVRAKIDMTSPNLHLRDPVIYRIKKAAHHRTASKWRIYPTYDFAHCIEDSIEGITHSICTLEFEVHRPLYDWILDALDTHHPQQIEFARLNVSHTVMSKRKLLELVEDGQVGGWDDPRMPTLCGLRRRGFTPTSIRTFCERLGVTKVNSVTDVALLDHCVREELNKTASRAMVVLDPIKLVIDDYPEGKADELDAVNNPEDEAMGSRKVPFSRVLYIERDDFREDPPKKFFRLAPGREVRLRYGYLVTCTDVVKDDRTGEILEVHCTHDPDSRGGTAPDGRRVKGTIHWVSADHSKKVEVRLYDRLFNAERPDDVAEDGNFKDSLNPESFVSVTAMAEPGVSGEPGRRYQFERKGYFFADPVDSSLDAPVFNRIVALRDSWAKVEKRGKG
jgi:glutaminyl-tRNA synthetase